MNDSERAAVAARAALRTADNAAFQARADAGDEVIRLLERGVTFDDIPAALLAASDIPPCEKLDF